MNCKDIDNPQVAIDNAIALRQGGHEQLIHINIDLHIKSYAEGNSSLSPSPSSNDELPSSWSSIFSIIGIYMHAVLGVANPETSPDFRFLQFMVLKMKNEMEKDVDEMKGHYGRARQDLWFWKAFILILALAKALRQPQNQDTSSSAASEGYVRDLRPVLRWLEDKIWAWSRASGTIFWQDAKIALQRIVWPSEWHAEPLAEALWCAISGRR